MPDSAVTVVGEEPTSDQVRFVRRPYRRLTRRFVEAGALAWLRDLDSVELNPDWVAALELCALVTGQVFPMARRVGARTAVLTWGNDARNPLYRLPPYRLALDRARRADRVICLIEAAKEHCVELGIPEERCTVVMPPLDTELFHPPEQPVDEPIAIFVSPLATNKGIDRVLDAWPQVRAKVTGARLRVVGRGPLEGLVAERAAVDPSIELLGPSDRHGVADELRRAAVLVTAPRPTRVWNEQFGLAYTEAQACGLAVVTTVCGTNHEAVQAPNLRVPDTVGEVADGLVAMLGDPALRAHLFVHNRAEMVRRFAFGQQVAALRAALAA